MALTGPTVQVGLLERSNKRLLAVRIPTLDLTGHEVLFFEHYRARIVPVDLSGSTEAGVFAALSPLQFGASVSADLEKFRRLLPYLLVIRDCGSQTKALVRVAAQFESFLNSAPGNPQWKDRLARRFDSFALLSALKEADVTLCEIPPHHDALVGFDIGLSQNNLSQIDAALNISAATEDLEFFASLRFSCLEQARTIRSTGYMPLTATTINDYLDVMRSANQRGLPVFDDPADFNHAREELTFSLRPDHVPPPQNYPFVRIDCWLARFDGKPWGAIGLALFSGSPAACWITWFATAQGGNALGAHLMSLALSTAKVRGFQTVYVWTGQQFHDAIKTYERWGFTPTTMIPPDAPPGTSIAAFERSLTDVDEPYPMCLRL